MTREDPKEAGDAADWQDRLDEFNRELASLPPLPVQAIEEFASAFCNTSARVRLRENVHPNVTELTGYGMAGILVNQLLQRRRSAPGTPSLHGHHMCVFLPTDGKLSTTAGDWLRGKCSTRHRNQWYECAERAIRKLLYGGTGATENEAIGRAGERVLDYFFSGDCSFFSSERLDNDHVWDWPEAAGEISWVSLQKQLSGEPALLVFVSGASPYLQVDENGLLTPGGHATIQAAKEGVRTVFLYPDTADAEPARSSVRLLKQHLNDAPLEEIPIDVQSLDPQQAFAAGRVLSPFLRFTLSRCQVKGRKPAPAHTESNLYISHGKKPSQTIPLAWRADPPQVSFVAEWVATILAGKDTKKSNSDR